MKKRTTDKPATTGGKTATTTGPRIQGEGDYESARRYQRDVERFVQTADIEGAARAAAPANAREAADMAAAEAAGRKRAKRASRAPRSRAGAR